jgi:hypothetical protein
MAWPLGRPGPPAGRFQAEVLDSARTPLMNSEAPLIDAIPSTVRTAADHIGDHLFKIRWACAFSLSVTERTHPFLAPPSTQKSALALSIHRVCSKTWNLRTRPSSPIRRSRQNCGVILRLSRDVRAFSASTWMPAQQADAGGLPRGGPKGTAN